MNIQTSTDIADYYGPAAYRAEALPPLRPTNCEGGLGGLLRTPLRWGQYAHLEPWQDVGAYMKPEAHLYRDHLERTGGTDLFINHQRWNFENLSAFLILVPYLKWGCLLFWPWLFWGFSITGASSGVLHFLDNTYGSDLGMWLLISLNFFSLEWLF